MAHPSPQVVPRELRFDSELREKLELYRQIYAHLPEPIAVVDVNGEYLEQNAAHRALTGYTDEQLAGQTPAIHLGTETFARIAGALQTTGRFHGEVLSRTAAGELRNLELSAFAVHDSNGRVQCYVGIKRDITERKRAESERAARLKELESVYLLTHALNRAFSLNDIYAAAIEALVTSLHADRASILTYDDGGVMRFRAWHGLSDGYRAAVEGHSPWSQGHRNPQPIVVPDVLEDEGLAPFRATISGEGIRALGFVPIVFEGTLLGKFMIYFNQPHSFTEDEMRMAEAVSAHVAVALQRRRAEEALHRAEKLAAAGRLAATIAHEINNPLEAVINLLYLARREQTQDKVRELLSTAEEEVGRVSQIARRGLAFYRETTSPTAVNMGELLDEMLGVYGHNMRGLKIERVYGPGLVLQARRGELAQLFSNLIINAIDAVGDSGTIRLEAHSPAEGVIEVTVADDGSGISSEHMPHIFESFFSTKQHVGTGLGLWVAKGIAEKHGGDITVESHTSGPERGTRFRVTLRSL